MSRVTIDINSRQMEAALARVAAARTARKALTAAGSSARKDLRPLIAEMYSTSMAGAAVRGKAPAPGGDIDRLAYTIRVRRKIKLEKLRASARKFRRRRRDPLGLLRIAQPQPTGSRGADLFRARRGEQKGEFVLPGRTGRRQRLVGGVPVSLHKGAVGRRVERIGEDLVQAMLTEMQAALAKR